MYNYISNMHTIYKYSFWAGFIQKVLYFFAIYA